MALKGYSSATLNGNWFEQRASEHVNTRGVIADYGVETKESTFKCDFMPAPPAKPRGVPRAGMVTQQNLAFVLDRLERSGQSVGGFGKLLPAHPRGQDKRYMSTTHRVDFDNQGGGGEPFGYTSYIAQRRNKSPRRRAAGAPPNGMPKGSRWSGATGEIFNCGADPQSNTAAQRSWMYTEDASFSVSEAEVRAKAESNDASYMSLPVGEGMSRQIPGPRKSTTITATHMSASRRPGVNIFQDADGR